MTLWKASRAISSAAARLLGGGAEDHNARVVVLHRQAAVVLRLPHLLARQVDGALQGPGPEVLGAAGVEDHRRAVAPPDVVEAFGLELHHAAQGAPDRRAELVAAHVRVAGLEQLLGEAVALPAERTVAVEDDRRRHRRWTSRTGSWPGCPSRPAWALAPPSRSRCGDAGRCRTIRRPCPDGSACLGSQGKRRTATGAVKWFNPGRGSASFMAGPAALCRATCKTRFSRTSRAAGWLSTLPISRRWEVRRGSRTPVPLR